MNRFLTDIADKIMKNKNNFQIDIHIKTFSTFHSSLPGQNSDEYLIYELIKAKYTSRSTDILALCLK